VDESAGGLRLSRPVAQTGRRIAAGQLLAVQPPGATGLRLGAVRWLRLCGDELHAGLRLMPGAPQPLTLSATGLTSAVGPRYRPGFGLPAVEALQQPASVVFPAGAFRVERIIEILGHPSTQVRLKRILDRGSDFERAEYAQT
jgi:cyclic-di-GMP-binding protein